MEPFTLALILGGFQIVNGFGQADAIESNARLNQQINDMNADFIELDAFNANAMGFSESARFASIVDRTIGAQRAALAGAGVDVTTGTAKEIQKEAKLIGQLNILDIQQKAHNEAYGLKVKAVSVRLQGEVNAAAASANASAARTTGLLSGVSTGVSAFSLRESGKKDKKDKEGEL